METVFEGAPSLAYPQAFADGYIYLGVDKGIKTRTVIKYECGGKTLHVTPDPFSLRSSICEYGGKSFWINGNSLVFVNQADQCLYMQDICESISQASSPSPHRVSPLPNDNESYRYADLCFISSELVLAVVEQDQDDNSASESFIGLLNLSLPDSPPIQLSGDSDFHSNLCFDLNSNTLAWVQWNHPNMPWDTTQLMLADIDLSKLASGEVSLSNAREVNLGSPASVCQLIFANNGILFFSADFANREQLTPANYWNIYAIPNIESGDFIAVSECLKEFGYPHWQYGNARIVQLDDSRLLTIASSELGDEVFLIDQDSLKMHSVGDTDCGFENLSSNGAGQAMCLMLSQNKLPQLASFDCAMIDSRPKPSSNPFIALGPQRSLMDDAHISLSQHFEYSCADGEIAYGYYYPPTNPAYTQGGEDSQQSPPLLVMVHGGPTARSYGYFDIQKQFWTQRGFAIFDVNHTGSSGYGRKYRDALYGKWGVKDCQDIVDGVAYLVSKAKADSNRVCIRGKSAGGYAVLRALTEFPQVFSAGACYYGIGNLVTLAETTHKFEKYYTDRLIDEPYDSVQALTQQSKFYQRSPINKLDQLASAMIVFQGGMDKVVPPSVAHEVIETLKALNLGHSYVEYPDEGHGFRNSENNIDAWTKELDFYHVCLAP